MLNDDNNSGSKDHNNNNNKELINSIRQYMYRYCVDSLK